MTDYISEGCPEGDACSECGHCLASWHTKPIERPAIRNHPARIAIYCDVCPCSFEAKP